MLFLFRDFGALWHTVIVNNWPSDNIIANVKHNQHAKATCTPNESNKVQKIIVNPLQIVIVQLYAEQANTSKACCQLVQVYMIKSTILDHLANFKKSQKHVPRPPFSCSTCTQVKQDVLESQNMLIGKVVKYNITYIQLAYEVINDPYACQIHLATTL